MKKIKILFLIIASSFTAFAQPHVPQTNQVAEENFISNLPITIIPQPVSVIKKNGEFKLPQTVIIHAEKETKLIQSIKVLDQKFTTAAGRKVQIINSGQHATIKLKLNEKVDPIIGKEGYKLQVHNNQIVISANEPAGIYYGTQSLIQLFPAEIEKKELAKNVVWNIPNLEVTDYPKLNWRGMMFDVARHYFTKEEVKQFIDNMVRYKYNLLHFHLTDDEGWRIEIKGYPKLTEVGAWRVNKTGTFGDFIPPTPDEPKDYGGFYTQEDIKELVKYAKERFVDILPEVDVPGHSLAAIASYPELSCTPDAVNYNVRSGEKIMDWSRGAPPSALVDNTLCPTNEKVYVFLDTVISQLAELFPFEYIHMGGDEAPRNFWAKNESIKKLMAQEGLKTIPQVQAYFTKRVEKIVNSKGKKFIGWDEILEGGIEPSAAIMNWRSTKYGIEAAKAGHPVIMTPSEFAYIDYMQGDVSTEPRVYASLRLNKSYEFNPIPAGVDPKLILGAQANLWAEQIYNIRQVEYMSWPRGFAIAESAWSPNENKNWNSFVQRTEDHFKRLDFNETKFSPAIYDPIISVKKNASKQLLIDLNTEIDGLDIYYSFDNSSPDRFYPKYKSSLTVPKDASLFRVVTYRGKQEIGRQMSIPIADLQKRTK